MNWANRITLSRLALTVLFVVTLNSSWQYARTTALVIFLIAAMDHPYRGDVSVSPEAFEIVQRSLLAPPEKAP